MLACYDDDTLYCADCIILLSSNGNSIKVTNFIMPFVGVHRPPWRTTSTIYLWWELDFTSRVCGWQIQSCIWDVTGRPPADWLFNAIVYMRVICAHTWQLFTCSIAVSSSTKGLKLPIAGTMVGFINDFATMRQRH